LNRRGDGVSSVILPEGITSIGQEAFNESGVEELSIPASVTTIGISNRIIGNIYCITISAVQHRKLKLKKEVFGESNPDITLEQVLNSK
jgi:hypothetical protein